MSALDKVRSFAEARIDDRRTVIRDGLTYADCDEILARVRRLEEELSKLRDGFVASIEAREGTITHRAALSPVTGGEEEVDRADT